MDFLEQIENENEPTRDKKEENFLQQKIESFKKIILYIGLRELIILVAALKYIFF